MTKADVTINNRTVLLSMIAGGLEDITGNGLETDALSWLFCRNDSNCEKADNDMYACRECLRRWLEEPYKRDFKLIDGRFVIRKADTSSAGQGPAPSPQGEGLDKEGGDG